jgi:uncharacterized membrane protein
MTDTIASAPTPAEHEPTPVLTAPDAVVAVYATEADLATAVRLLEHERYDMSTISVLGKGMSQERHVVGFETAGRRTTRWASWGGLWGWLFGALLFVPGVGHVAVGGYLLFMLTTAGIGAVSGALGGALSSSGIPADGIPVYEADLRAEHFLLIAHGSPGDVARARDLLARTRHERLDHHRVVDAAPVTS